MGPIGKASSIDDDKRSSGGKYNAEEEEEEARFHKRFKFDPIYSPSPFYVNFKRYGI